MNLSCREFLREMFGRSGTTDPRIEAHLASCRFCADRRRAQASLASTLRARPQMEVDPRELLERIHARAIDQAEGSALGQLLDEAMPVAPMADVESAVAAGWPESLLDSRAANIVGEVPRPPSSAAWSKVRVQILARVAAQSVAVVRRRWMLGVAGAAAVAVVFLTTARTSTPPTIVFRELNAGELASLGNFEFVVVRHGATR